MNNKPVDQFIVVVAVTDGPRSFMATVYSRMDLCAMRQGFEYNVVETLPNGARHFKGDGLLYDNVRRAREAAAIDIMDITAREEPINAEEDR